MKNQPIKISREDFWHNPEIVSKIREILNELKQINKINKGETK